MRAVKLIEGGVSVLDRNDVDTDQIIPKQFLKRVERTGFGEFLFYDWAKMDGWEPGTTMASTLLATVRPSTSLAAARRSPMRLFVHEPMKTRSSRISCIGVPASRPMYLSAR